MSAPYSTNLEALANVSAVVAEYKNLPVSVEIPVKSDMEISLSIGRLISFIKSNTNSQVEL